MDFAQQLQASLELAEAGAAEAACTDPPLAESGDSDDPESKSDEATQAIHQYDSHQHVQMHRHGTHAHQHEGVASHGQGELPELQEHRRGGVVVSRHASEPYEGSSLHI
eukprot:4426084-Amphidinium_carterae.1